MSSQPPAAKRRRQGDRGPLPSSADDASPVDVFGIDYSNVKVTVNGKATENDASNDDASNSTNAGKGRAPPATLTLKSGLSDILHGLGRDAFLESYFRRKAVHMTCENSDHQEQHAATRVSKLREAMFDLDVSTILQETSSDSIFLWLRKPNGQVGESEYENDSAAKFQNETIHSIEVADVDTAIALHKTAGHATYCRAPPAVEQCLVSNLLRDTGLGCGQYDPSGSSIVCLGRGEVETFISTPGHLTNWHYDFQENFTIQLSGTKRWTVQSGTIKDPIRGCTPHYASPEAVESQIKAAHLHDRKFKFGYPKVGINAIGDVATIDIKPGDAFYFPAGMWHKIETVEPGVSINVSLMASNYAAVACQALQHLLMTDPKWRAPIVHNNVNEDAIATLNGLLNELPDTIKKLQSNQNGAQAIIPPILQHAPRFAVSDDDDGSMAGNDGPNIEDCNDNNDDDDDDGSMANCDPNIEVSNHTNDHDDDSDGHIDDDNGSADDNQYVDPLTFDEYPESWKFDDDDDENIQIYRNPLATLTKCSELRSFYTEPRKIDENCFVLNVNFAGNEMHQSNVRVEFKVHSHGLASKLEQIEISHQHSQLSEQQPSAIPNGDANDTEFRRLKKFLLYHGYFLHSSHHNK
mmetsp:Transcript_20382/g.57935  ORF Transcript_20382/g.57935 Transcript_20382/m.57935 type:complete len:636 (-) Transcript_20382:3753-5660(-)